MSTLPVTTLPNPFVTSLTVGIGGLISKAFVKLACSTEVVGSEHLINAWKEENRVRRGILTVSNHISVLDDPLMWGVLPMSSFFNSRQSRWTLGARDIMFTRPSHATFFRNGKVIDTIRGVGVYQEALDVAIERLNAGEWVHIFPQGFVRQETLGPPVGRLKWGVGRLLAECQNTPTVIPVWINGFENVMPAERGFPRFLPRSANLHIAFDDPSRLTSSLEEQRRLWRDSASDRKPTLEEWRGYHAELTSTIEQGMNYLGNKISLRSE